MQKQITVFEIRLKVFLLKDIPLSKMLTAEAYFIDSVLTKDQEWLTYHETNQYKLYCMNGLFPLERDGIYKKEQIYTITIRTVEAELARYFAKELSNHSSNQMKGLIAERRIVPRKMISEIYTLTPVMDKTWCNRRLYRRRLSKFQKNSACSDYFLCNKCERRM